MKNKNLILGLCAITSLALGVADVKAEGQYAGKERSAVAKAHMARARTLLVEALEEFEESKKYARPDLLIDSEDWRLRVISLTEQLNRVIDPKPRITREGAVFRVPPRLVKREKENLPIVADGAKSRSDFGEKNRMESNQQERARLFSNSGAGKEPLRIGKAKGQLPEDLAVPEEPKIMKDSSADALNKRNPSNEKALFTEELLPQMEASKVKADSKIQEESVNTANEEESQNVNSEKKDPEVEIIDEESVPAKNNMMDSQKEIQDMGVKQETIIEDQSKAVKPMDIESNKIEAEVEKQDISSDETRKQLSEDEELAKRLDDTVYDRINSGK